MPYLEYRRGTTGKVPVAASAASGALFLDCRRPSGQLSDNSCHSTAIASTLISSASWAHPPPIRNIRQRIVTEAQGKVLEIGVGSGANFVHYDPAKVSKLYALEPNPGMLRLAEGQRRRTTLDVEFLDLPGERIPLPDGAVDTVVSTFTLCTIPGVLEAIRGIARVLKPDGRLIFFELGLAPDTRVQRWQVRVEGIPKVVIIRLVGHRDVAIPLAMTHMCLR